MLFSFLGLRFVRCSHDGFGFDRSSVSGFSDASGESTRCLVRRRCVVCGTEVAPGPIYRPADGEEAEFIAVALRFGKLYCNAPPAREGAGHLSCMIYSAIVCPYLASPGARRKFEVQLGPEAVPRGDPRGAFAAVVGYDDSWDISDQGLDIFYGQPVELLSYASGTDLLAELHAEIAREREPAQACPAYLLDDDAKAERAAWAVLEGGGPSPTQASRRQNQARKSPRAARRRNRCLCHDRT